MARPRPDEPPVAGPRLEQRRVARRADRLDVDIRLQPARDVAVRDQRGGAHQAGFLAIGDEDHQRPVAIGARGQHARGLERHADAERIIAGARSRRHRVVVRDDADRFRPPAGPHRDDVGDARRQPERSAAGIRLLHPDLEPEEAQLVGDVGAGFGVGRRADRAAADRPGQHADVGAGVRFGKESRRPRTPGRGRHHDRSEKQAEPEVGSRIRSKITPERSLVLAFRARRAGRLIRPV